MARMLGEAFIVVSTTGPDRAQIDANVRRSLAGLNPKVKIGADVSGLGPALAAMEARLKSLSSGRVALADLIDLNVPQGQIVSQLLLLKRLIQQSGLSDMLGVNLNDSEIAAQLEKISRLSANISVGADTTPAQVAVAGLAARFEALSGMLTGLRVGASTTQAEAAVAALQARLAALSKSTAKIIMSADTSKLDAQIAAEQARLATLRRQASGLQMDADTTKAAAKISALQVQAARLYDQLDNLEADADATPLLTKIYAIEAELRVLQSNAKAIELNAQTAAINAAIAATEAKIEALKASAADIRLGGNVDTAGLAAADARLLALQAAAEKLSKSMAGAAVASSAVAGGAAAAGTAAARSGADAGKATGFWAALGRTFATTGIGWGATIGGIAGWHIVLDLAIEAAISLGTATLALGAAALAAYPAIDQLGYGVNHSLQAMTALGTDAGPLAGVLDKLQKSVVPQVYEAFGGALELATGQTSALSRAAHDVINMIDTWIAKIDLWSASQNGVNGLLHTGTGYLAQFGKFFGILGDAISNLLQKDPGIARYLLDILQGLAGLIDWFSKLPGPVVEAVLALHGLYLWGSVFLGILGKLFGPLASLIGWITKLGVAGEEAAAVGGLSAVLGKAATSAKAFGAGLLAIADNPLTWVVLAAAGVAYLAYQMTQASSSAKDFIGSIESGLSQASASQAISQISYDVGGLRSQISATQVENGNLVIGLANTATASGDAFKNVLRDAPLSNQQFKDLASGVTNAVKAFLGFQSVGPVMKQNSNDVSAFTGEIVKLTGEQTSLFHVMGLLVTGTNKLGIGAISAGQALGLMDMAGVTASDNFAVMWQKVTNLVKGYQAMSIQGGLLANSINAMNFATAQQDSKVTQLNSDWDTFFQTVSGGATGFNSFATQAMGLYTSLGDAAAKLSVSNGKASISLTAQTAAAQKGAPSITGLTTADIQLRDSFLQTATAANSQMDNLTLLASAAGLGAKGTAMLTQANKDMVAQLLPAAKGSQEMTSILYALAQRGGYQGADSFKALAEWVGNTRDPMTQLDKITSQLTTDASNLTKDVQNLTIALGQSLTGAMAAAILQATGGQQAFDQFATAVLHSQFNSQAQQTSALALANQLYSLTGNTQDAENQFITFAQQMGMSRAQADQLWNEIVGKLNPALANSASTLLPQLENSFDSWANNGLHYSTTKADELWSEIITKLGPQLDGLGNLAGTTAKQKFIDWAENGLGLSKSAAQALYNELVTLQQQIDSLHGTTISIKMTGAGTYTINGQVAPTPSGGVPFSTAVTKAVGGYIDMGSGPTADDVPILASKGEYVVRASSVNKYGTGMMDAINAGRFADGGAVGAYSGNLTPGYIDGMYQTFQDTMGQAMVTSMQAAIKSAASAAAAAAAAVTGAVGGGAAQWAGVVHTVLTSLGLPYNDAPTILSQINTESGGNPTIVNRWDSNWAAGHPSVGLMQVIAGTFDSYAGPLRSTGPFEYGVSVNPTANVYAGVNYATHAYGNPGFLSVLGHGHGYALGGLIRAMASGGSISKDQAAELAAYYAFAGAFARSLPGASAGSWLKAHRTGIAGELKTLAKRQSVEEAAYDAVVKSAGATSHVSHFGTTLREMTTTLGDQDLSYGGPGGQPGKRTTLLTWIKALQGLKYPGALAGASVPKGGSTVVKATKAIMNSLIGKGGPGEVLQAPVPVLPSYYASGSALQQALSAMQAGVRAKEFGLVNSFQIGFAQHPVKGTWLYENRGKITSAISALSARHQAELAAYNAISGTGMSAQTLQLLGAAAQAETIAAENPVFSARQLTPNWAGGHPLWDVALRQNLAGIISIANGTASGSKLPVLPTVTDTIGQVLALATTNLGQAAGGLIPARSYDSGGYLPPGLSMAWNGTGAPEPVGGQPVHVSISIGSSGNTTFDQLMLSWMRKNVKVHGGGNVQRAFGQH